MQRIAIDVMGGDLGVVEVVRGAMALSMEPGNEIQMLLVGDAKEIFNALMGEVYHPKFIEIVHAGDFIGQDEKSKDAIHREGLSVVVAAQLVQDGRADALVSAGNTGGVILATSTIFQRIKGIRRVGFAAVLPTERKRGRKKDPFALLMDVGATLHVEPEDLYN